MKEDVHLPGLRVVTMNGECETQMLCSMDDVVARAFKTELPLTITKTLLSTALKAGVAYGASRATRSNTIVNLGTRLAFTGYQIATNRADLRTWLTLPKHIEYCRFVTPEDRTIHLRDLAGVERETLSLSPGQVNVVWVKCVNPDQPLLVSQFVLR